MFMIHAIKSAVRSGRHTQPMRRVRRWQSSAPFPMAAANRFGDLISVRPSVDSRNDLSSDSENDK
jgi:hypothetical protein